MPAFREVYRATHARLLREVFGCPFRPAAFASAWRSQAVLGLAAGVYGGPRRDDGAFADPQALAVLADALEDADCNHAELLAHLRGPGPHVRGCWAVDLILGNE